MSKQYISTASTASAHESDIHGLVITNKYTITCSTDGYVNFWDNKNDETHNPRDSVTKVFVNKIGLHHLASYETILPDSKFKIVILAIVAFDGKCYLKYFINDDVSTLTDVNLDGEKRLSTSSWCPGFYLDPMSKMDFFVLTQSSGETLVYDLNIIAKEGDSTSIQISLANLKVIESTSFPNTIGISSTESKTFAIGYYNGDVILYDLISLKPIYTFKSTDVQSGTSQNARSSSNNGGVTSSPVPRSIQFSPGGSVLAVARDNQSAGSITIYDAKYGENVGSLTTPSHSTKNNGGFAHEQWVMMLSFNEDGNLLASAGLDKCIRVWDIETRERVSKISISQSDLDNEDDVREMDNSIASGVQFIKKGVRGGMGGDTNDGLCVISFDRGIRWYREAGGI
ncbi:antiviral protein Ski8p [[Candida] railenensis]|uniref:Antiviral protein Ski8p n=1 Tax=[Candida] railenensis TaxID=45579 RepID=A0A9P0QJ31_9ASCO|nr:antiviral protein Ski8p [[Candida] railenensis]